MIRDMRAEDIDTLAAIEKACFEAGYADKMMAREDFAAALADKAMTIFCCVHFFFASSRRIIERWLAIWSSARLQTCACAESRPTLITSRATSTGTITSSRFFLSI